MQATDIFCLKHYINLVQTAVASVPVEQNAIDCHIRILAKWASKRSVDAHFLKNIVFFFSTSCFHQLFISTQLHIFDVHF